MGSLSQDEIQELDEFLDGCHPDDDGQHLPIRVGLVRRIYEISVIDRVETNEYVRLYLVGYDRKRKIQAMKNYRLLKMVGLKATKETIDAFQRGDQEPIYQGLMPRSEAQNLAMETPYLRFELRPVDEAENVVDLSKL